MILRKTWYFFAKSQRRHRSGILTKRKVKQLLENGDISQEAFDKLFDGARAFFSKAYQYCVRWFTTGGFPSSKLQICWFWSEKHFFVWLRSTYSWIFWSHKSAINRTSRVIRHVGGRIYGVPSHVKRWCTTRYLGWSFR